MADAHPWQKFYPQGARWDADLSNGPVQDILSGAAERFGDMPALEFMGRRITYRELDALANRAAAGFQKLGVGPACMSASIFPTRPTTSSPFSAC